MEDHIPTGPHLVGLETVVMPSVARLTRRMAGASVLVRAPRCRLGSAEYSVRVWSPGQRRTRWQYVEITSTLRSGGQMVRPVPDDWDDVEILLDLVSLRLSHHAFSTWTSDALVDALSHPLDAVREAALCAMHRVWSE
jgi:hypothetical protein